MPVGEDLSHLGRPSLSRSFQHGETYRQDVLHHGQPQLIQGIVGNGVSRHRFRSGMPSLS